MRFYKIDMRGKFYMPNAAGVPSARGLDEESRLHYNSTTQSMTFADSTTWVDIYSKNNISQLATDLSLESAPLNADNLDSGTVPAARLTGNYDINITGTATYA